MATFQGDDREDDVQVRSQRVRQLPRHLRDYDLGFPAKQLPPLERHLHQATDSQSASQLVPADFITPVPTLQRTDKEEQWHRIEARCNDLTKQLQELQLEMDSVKRLPYPQSAPAYQPSYPLSYHHYPPQYTSLPRLTLDSPAGSHRSTPVHSPARYTTAAGEEPLQQPVSQRGSPSRQPSLLPQTGEPRAQDEAILTQPVHQASTQVPMDEGWISNHNSALHTPHRQDGRPPRSAPQPIMPQALPAQPVNHPLPVQPSNPLRPTHYSLPPSIQYQSYPQYPAYPPEVYPPGGYYPYYTSLPPAAHMPPMPSLAPYGQPVPPRGPTAPGILEMAIASSYGIPKPKLIPFSSGKESDFIMMKKGLYSVLSPHKHLTEDYKYQVLLDLLKLPNAYQVAKRYVNDPTPYSSAMHALEQRYGQPRQLIQGELKAILNSPPIKPGDAQALEDFSSAVSTLVGLLSTIDGSSRAELRCGSHVDTLLSKLPATYRDRFAEHCISKGIIRSGSDRTYTLPDFADWLERKAQAIQVARRATEVSKPEVTQPERKNRTAKPQQSKFATIYVTNQPESSEPPQSSVTSTASSNPGQASKKRERFKPYCPYCSNQEHYLSACTEFAKLSTAEKGDWIKEKSKCWRCGRGHKPESCTLKKPCSTCNEQHLLVLHEVATKACQSLFTGTAPSSMVYVSQSSHSRCVMVKVIPIQLHSGDKTLDTYAILDDGSERTILLPAAARHLGLHREDEVLLLRTIRQDVVKLNGASVSFEVCNPNNTRAKYAINHAFTAEELSLADQSCPAERLKKRFDYLRGVPVRGFSVVQPSLLIGSDHPHLITPVRPVLRGPQGSPVAVCTLLGWTIQGPTNFLQTPSKETSCLHAAFQSPNQDLLRHVEMLWQVDTLPFRSEKEATRSKQDQLAVNTLDQRTVRVTVDGIARYATPLLRKPVAPKLHAPPLAVMPLLRATEQRLTGNPDLAKVYNEEIHKLERAGYVIKISSDEASQSEESWYIPHHIVHHNGKARVVFNCSFKYQQTALNDILLPGPNLGASLLGVLLRFREYLVAISGDIRGMFHQIRLLPEDQPLLRFLWRDMEKERSPDIYEWRVLPFGTACSPCCAIYALQQHVKTNSAGYEEVLNSVNNAFYVDNCLQSLCTPLQARQLIDKMRVLLAAGGFDMRQWASNRPEVIAHLPSEARSEGCELWLTAERADPQESTLGLRWHCPSDTLGYKYRQLVASEPTLRNVYRVLASQYDPLGYIIPYTTCAKVLIQALWRHEQQWDEPITGELLSVWQNWESELPHLQHISMPRCCMPVNMSADPSDLHVFCDASEKAYGSVAYLPQADSFPEELSALQHDRPIRPSSRLISLSPEYDYTLGLIRVGGRLRKADDLPKDSIHPIILAPDHPITQLLVRDYDDRLLHAGPERVFAEIRRVYWILKGRQAIRKHQRHCVECRRWRSKPTTPKMADLPAARLRLNKPPFWSTGVDCFGPYTVKIGRRQEKRWGIIFKCLTSRCVHLDLMPSMDTDSFLLALRRFIARRGKPYEILCDRGTNFRGGEKELQQAFEALEPSLKEQLAKQCILFRFNPPLTPHFGGVWEREIKSVKASLQTVLKDQVLPEEALMTVLIEVEGILNSKPLGYASSDLADPDPITPNLLLMGRRDASLPQAVYGSSDLLGRRRWRHSQVLADHFWGQFTRKYLPGLQPRQKWRTTTPDLAVGTVVMVLDPQLPRALWPVGRITRIILSDDGKVRAAEVDIKGNLYTRPVAKLVELPEMPDDREPSAR
ncbi:hypothetical protein MHYP_G00080500 [Metynnis hypsauchen]